MRACGHAGIRAGGRAVMAACPSGYVAGLRAEALAVCLEAALAYSYPVLGEPPRDAGPAGLRGGGRASANMAGLRGEDKMALAQGPPLPHALGAPRPLPETGRSPSPRLGAFLELPGGDPTALRAFSPTSAWYSGMFSLLPHASHRLISINSTVTPFARITKPPGPQETTAVKPH